MLKIKGLKSKVATQSDNRGSEEKAESLGKAHERKPGSKVGGGRGARGLGAIGSSSPFFWFNRSVSSY